MNSIEEQVLELVDREQPDTLFVYDQVTPSVRAGRRYPITRRPKRFVYQADIPVAPPPHANMTALEATLRGKRVGLWEAHLFRPPNAGDVLTFTLEEA